LATLIAMVADRSHPNMPGPDASARTGRDSSAYQRESAALQRDAAIARVSRARGGVIAGTAGLTAALAALASALHPGHSLGATTHLATGTATAPASRNGTPVMPPLASPATLLGLQSPGATPSSSSQPAAAAPAAVAAAPAVVSGGS
jgi:hypothetical protein